MNDVLYFSSDEWHSGLKTSQYHIAKGISKQRKLLYINSVGLRRPKADIADTKRVFEKIFRFAKGSKQINENLYVLTPLVVPFHSNNLAKVVNRYLLTLLIRYHLSRQEMHNIDIITFLPNLCKVICSIPHQKMIYYCADNLTAFNGVDESAVEDMERDTMDMADSVVVTSQQLMAQKSIYNPVYCPHGVDFKLFNSALDPEQTIPPDVAQIKKPILGFFGHISNDWIDFELLAKIANANDWSIVLIGKVAHDTPDLSLFPNVHYLGPKPYESLPGYCRAFDLGLIPFKNNGLAEFSNPIKAREYLAAGLPVVSTDIPELYCFASVIGVAKNHEEYLNFLHRFISDKNSEQVERRLALVREQSWEKVVNRILKLLN